MAEHSITTGHTRDLEDVERMEKEDDWKRREAKELCNIKMKKPKANKDRDTLEELYKVIIKTK